TGARRPADDTCTAPPAAATTSTRTRPDVAAPPRAAAEQQPRQPSAPVPLGRLPRRVLDPLPMRLPDQAGRQVGGVALQADRSVDQLTHQVGVAGVAVGLGDDVDEDLVQGDAAPL